MKQFIESGFSIMERCGLRSTGKKVLHFWSVLSINQRTVPKTTFLAARFLIVKKKYIYRCDRSVKYNTFVIQLARPVYI